MNIDRIEKRLRGLLFTESACCVVFYVTSKEDDRIGLIVGDRAILLERGQARAICEELMTVFDTFVGRGAVSMEQRGRKRKR